MNPEIEALQRRISDLERKVNEIPPYFGKRHINSLSSFNFRDGYVGWKINENGVVQLNAPEVSGPLYFFVSSGVGTGYIAATSLDTLLIAANGSDSGGQIELSLTAPGVGQLIPGGDNQIKLGIPSARWSDVQTVQINGEPVYDGLHKSTDITYISGTGTAGTDNTAQTLITVVLPANSLTQVGDRIRIRAYWTGDNGTAITATTSINGVPVGDTTDAGAASLQICESWIHYIDNTHGNIIEQEGGALGNLSAPNVSGFDWDSNQNITFAQNQIANNHCILYALIIDIFPKKTV